MGRKLKRNVVITAALPYANSDLHLGHVASTYLPPDILYRFLKLQDHSVILVSASDDYGTPILIAAQKEGEQTSEYVEKWNKRFREDLGALGIQFDLFYRTSSPENVKLVQHFFTSLYKKRYIYVGEVDQFYCEFDRKYLPDRYVKGTCPYCGTQDQYSDLCEHCGRTIQPGQILQPRCSICGRVPITKKSAHYFFKLSAFSGKLEKWLRKNKGLQAEPKNYVLSWISEGLQDWDITRDIQWGVPIPLSEAEGKVLYGWFDNHLCYISTALKAASKSGQAGVKYWNDSTIYHFIGKDIVYHHYLFLASMRMGEGTYKLPDHIPTRGHLLLQEKKFSKSRHWMITIREFLKDYPPDYLRFYLTRITAYSQTDSNFDWNEFKEKINNELVANIGNFVYRTLVFIRNKHRNIVPKPGRAEAAEKEVLREITQRADGAAALIKEGHYDRALKTLLDLSSRCNKYFQHRAPWENKKDEPTTVYYSANFVASLAILLHPFLPFSSEEIWRQLAIKKPLRDHRWQDAKRLIVKPKQRIATPKPLFRKVEDTEVAVLEQKLASAA